MRVDAQIKLWPSDRRFRLPATDTPSMLFRFVQEDTFLGGRATSLDGIPFAPGTDHSARIDFWAEDAATAIVSDGSRFTVRYLGDIGEGVVTAIS